MDGPWNSPENPGTDQRACRHTYKGNVLEKYLDPKSM